MKFRTNLNSPRFLACHLCGGEDFRLVPTKKLTDDEEHRLFIFYECSAWARSGFWTHAASVDAPKQSAIALARYTAPGRGGGGRPPTRAGKQSTADSRA